MTLQWNTKFLKFKLFNDDTTSFAAYLLILSSWVDSSFPSFSHLTSIICIICSDCDIFSLTWNVIVFSSNNFALSFSWPQSRDDLTYLFSKTSWYFLCLHSVHSSYVMYPENRIFYLSMEYVEKNSCLKHISWAQYTSETKGEFC